MDRLASMRIFARVIEAGSFAGAARALELSPAVVTRLVADLESHLGTRLLHRTTRHLALTEAGEIYAERLRGILQDIDDAEAVASARTEALAGVLRIASPAVLSTHILAPALASFHEMYPAIRFDVHVDAAGGMAIEDFDLTLLGLPQGTDGTFVARRIVAAEAILVAAPAYLHRCGTPATPAELARHATLRIRIDGVRSDQLRLTAPDGTIEEIAITPLLIANHNDTLMQAAIDGLGITSTTLDLAAPLLETGQLVRVLTPWITGRFAVYAALPSRKFMPRRTRVFLEHLTRVAQQRIERAAGCC